MTDAARALYLTLGFVSTRPDAIKAAMRAVVQGCTAAEAETALARWDELHAASVQTIESAS